MLEGNVSLQVTSFCKCSSTVFTDERPLAQMNPIHMLVQVLVGGEELPTGVALVHLLPEVDHPVVPLHGALLAEDFGAGEVSAR